VKNDCEVGDAVRGNYRGTVYKTVNGILKFKTRLWDSSRRLWRKVLIKPPSRHERERRGSEVGGTGLDKCKWLGHFRRMKAAEYRH